MSGASHKSGAKQSLAGAKTIIKTLHKAGYFAYIAGGAARDIMLKRKSRDYDIATSASANDVQSIFEDTTPVGAAFGVVLVSINGANYDVATFRTEGAYLDGRRPSYVKTGSLEEDAKRRDFTINAMYLDPIRMKVVDPLGTGKIDLDNKIIRFVGDASLRVKEDHLRILRAVRFKNTLAFKYHQDTIKAIRAGIDLLNKISAERIRDELITMLLDSSRISALTDLVEFGLFKKIIPEIHSLSESNPGIFENIYSAFKRLPKKTDLRLVMAILILGLNPNDPEKAAALSKQILNQLRFPKLTTQDVAYAIQSQAIIDTFLQLPLAQQFNWFLDKRFALIIELAKVYYGNKSHILEIIKKEKEFKKNNPSQPVPLLKGNDLLNEVNVPPGPVIGEMLQLLSEAQLTSRVSSREEALALIRAEAKLRSLPLK